jgi:predicted NBD/HSP70 family sugar kinase
MKQTTRDIRRRNQMLVLQRIYASAPVSRQEITNALHLSPATVANVVSDLLLAGIVVEASFAASLGGRPRAMLEINAANGAFIGVDIAETYIHFALFDLGLRVRTTVEHVLRQDENLPAQIVQHVVAGLQTLIADSDVKGENILGVGVSVPGLVDRSGGVSVFAPNWGWHDVPLAAMLREYIDLPLYLDNPLKACAMAELWFGAGRGCQHLVTLNLGTGVGAGVVANGALYRGATNSAGEWGHTIIVIDGRSCRCGNAGCLEAYVGAPGIILTLREVAPHSDLLRLPDQTTIVAALANAAAHGEPDACAAVAATARYLSIGIANIINVFNPEVVVLGGWLGMRLGPALLPHVLALAKQFILNKSFDVAQIQLCQLPDNPTSIGAATFALESFLTTTPMRSIASTYHPNGTKLAQKTYEIAASAGMPNT